LYFVYPKQEESEIRGDIYYIPQTGLFIQTISPWGNDGYIIFSNISASSLTDKFDFIKANQVIGFSFLLNKNDRNNINIMTDEYVTSLKSKNLNFLVVDKNADSTFFEKPQSSIPRIIKDPYIEISLSENFKNVYMKCHGDTIFTKIEKYR